jgi:hypothetical protein
MQQLLLENFSSHLYTYAALRTAAQQQPRS